MKDFEAVAEQYRKTFEYVCVSPQRCSRTSDFNFHSHDCVAFNEIRKLASFQIADRMAARIRETHATER